MKVQVKRAFKKKLNLFIFTHAPKQNSPPGFYHYLLAEGNHPFLLKSVFWRFIFSSAETGRGMEGGGGGGGGGGAEMELLS